MTTPSLATVARVTREEVLEICSPESCIESTRALIEVLRYFGVTATPAPVSVAAFNAEAAACIRADVPPEEWPSSAYGLRIKVAGEEPAPGRWNGHLVAIADGCLVDASIDQFSRPGHGITLGVGSGVFGLPADWEAERELLFDGPDRMIIYRLLSDRSYRTAPAWRGHRDMQRAIAARAIRRLRGES